MNPTGRYAAAGYARRLGFMVAKWSRASITVLDVLVSSCEVQPICIRGRILSR